MGKGDTPPEKLNIFGLSEDQDRAERIKQMINDGENEMVEFKSTMCWNIHANQKDKKMEEVILKSIAAMSNRYGGTLFIGVKDDGTVLGLEKDYSTIREQNKDHFELHLRELVKNAYGTNFATSQLVVSFPRLESVEFCMVEVKRGKEPYYTKVSSNLPGGPKSDKLFVRSGNSSRELPIEDIPKYVGERFPQAS